MAAPTPPRPRGRPPLPEGDASEKRIYVYLTPDQVKKLDADRGNVSRSEWLATRAGLR